MPDGSSIRLRVAQAIAGDGHAIIPRTIPAERLEKLRSSIMGAWESALVFGGGDYLEQVYIPQYLGLVDVAAAAEQLYLAPTSADARHRLRRELDDFLKDLEGAKLRRDIYGRAADERFEKIRRLEAVVDRVRAVMEDLYRIRPSTKARPNADLETSIARLNEALAAVTPSAVGGTDA